MEQTEIRRILGNITDHKVAEIAASGLPKEELEKIAILLSEDTDHGIEIGRVSPKGQDLFALLKRDDEVWEIDREA